jgi:hypothetical protein
MTEKKNIYISNLLLEEVAALVLAVIIFVSDDNEDSKNIIIGMAEAIKAGLTNDEEG